MIAKRVALKAARKSDFGGLVTYITNSQGRAERVGSVKVTNCSSVEVPGAVLDVRAVQAASKAKGDKTYHLIISFRAEDRPTADQLRAVEERMCNALGFSEH